MHLVNGEGVTIAAYWSRDQAEVHARCVTGTRVQAVEVLEAIPGEILDDIFMDEHDNGWTPRDGVPLPVADPGAGAVSSSGATAADVEVEDGPGGPGPAGPHSKTRPY